METTSSDKRGLECQVCGTTTNVSVTELASLYGPTIDIVCCDACDSQIQHVVDTAYSKSNRYLKSQIKQGIEHLKYTTELRKRQHQFWE